LHHTVIQIRGDKHKVTLLEQIRTTRTIREKEDSKSKVLHSDSKKGNGSKSMNQKKGTVRRRRERRKREYVSRKDKVGLVCVCAGCQGIRGTTINTQNKGMVLVRRIHARGRLGRSTQAKGVELGAEEDDVSIMRR